MNKLLHKIILGISLAMLALPAAAQVKPLQGANLGIPEQGNLFNYILAIVNIMLALTGVAAGVFIVIAGIRYITSMGDPQEAEKAKKAIMYAVIGLIVIGLSAVLVNTVLSLF